MDISFYSGLSPDFLTQDFDLHFLDDILLSHQHESVQFESVQFESVQFESVQFESVCSFIEGERPPELVLSEEALSDEILANRDSSPKREEKLTSRRGTEWTNLERAILTDLDKEIPRINKNRIDSITALFNEKIKDLKRHRTREQISNKLSYMRRRAKELSQKGSDKKEPLNWMPQEKDRLLKIASTISPRSKGRCWKITNLFNQQVTKERRRRITQIRSQLNNMRIKKRKMQQLEQEGVKKRKKS